MYKVVAEPKPGINGTTLWLTERGTWVTSMRMGEARRFDTEAEALSVAAEKQEGLETRNVEVISA